MSIEDKNLQPFLFSKIGDHDSAADSHESKNSYPGIRVFNNGDVAKYVHAEKSNNDAQRKSNERDHSQEFHNIAQFVGKKRVVSLFNGTD